MSENFIKVSKNLEDTAKRKKKQIKNYTNMISCEVFEYVRIFSTTKRHRQFIQCLHRSLEQP